MKAWIRNAPLHEACVRMLGEEEIPIWSPPLLNDETLEQPSPLVAVASELAYGTVAPVPHPGESPHDAYRRLFG